MNGLDNWGGAGGRRGTTGWHRLGARAVGRGTARGALGIAALVVLLVGAGCAPNELGLAAGTSPGTVTARRGSIAQTVMATGAVVAANQSRLSFRVAGKIKTIEVQQGDTVAAGRVLATLEADDLAAAVQQAEAQAQAARAAVAVADAAVRMAEAKVGQVTGSARPELVAQAQAQAQAARHKLDEMLNPRQEAVAQAQAQLDVARQKLANLLASPREEAVRQAQADYDAARANLSQLISGPTAQQVMAQKQAVEAAKGALYVAQTGRDADVARGKLTPDQGVAQVALAQAALNKAQADFTTLVTPPTAQQVQNAQAAVQKAKAALDLARAPYTPEDVKQAQDAVAHAEQAVALAQKPYTPEQLKQAQDAVAQADAAVAAARKPFTDADVSAAQAAADQARAQADQARANVATADAAVVAARAQLANASLVAPVAGKVLLINNQVGENVTTTSAPIVLGAGDLVINGSIGEANVGKVRTGQDVDVAFDAYPGRVFKGTVKDVAPLALPTQTIVSYLATVAIGEGAQELRPGLTANLKIYVVRRDDAVLVPNVAIQSYRGKDIVMLFPPGARDPQPQEVETGIQDRENTEVVSGLQDGERLAIIGVRRGP